MTRRLALWVVIGYRISDIGRRKAAMGRHEVPIGRPIGLLAIRW